MRPTLPCEGSELTRHHDGHSHPRCIVPPTLGDLRYEWSAESVFPWNNWTTETTRSSPRYRGEGVEIDALKKIIDALNMEAYLGGENVDQKSGLTFKVLDNGKKLCGHKDEINMLIQDGLR
ncbi:hypothetical protein F52700_2487 [Fusarium sp. NRRL 52700]|nr:hypothetical protein F52700_2487 [Fusarium sp. NRRL 52700]